MKAHAIIGNECREGELRYTPGDGTAVIVLGGGKVYAQTGQWHLVEDCPKAVASAPVESKPPEDAPHPQFLPTAISADVEVPPVPEVTEEPEPQETPVVCRNPRHWDGHAGRVIPQEPKHEPRKPRRSKKRAR
jgi:hypothetical protein